MPVIYNFIHLTGNTSTMTTTHIAIQSKKHG